MKERIQQSFEQYWEQMLDRAPEITIGLITLIFFLFLAYAFRRLVNNRLAKRIEDRLLLNFIGRVTYMVFFIIGIVLFLNQIGLGGAAGGLLAGAGVSALILGFAFKDIGENFIAGFFLALSRPFSIGDIIEVNNYMGTVKAMSFRNSHIRTYNGRDIFIPNSIMIKNPLTNYTKDGLMRHDFVIGIDYGENITEATRVIMEQLTNNKNIPQEGELAPFVIIDQFGTSTVNLKVFFWINTFDVLESTTTLKSNVMKMVIEALINKGFNLPADIIELKIYQEGQPIPVSIKK